MKRYYLLLSLLTFTACSNNSNETAVNYVENSTIQKKGMEQIKTLIGGHLKPALMSSMKSDKSGVSGMKMCSSSATEMIKEYNSKLPKGSLVRRTALKYRNPKNKPDATDIAVMEKLKKEKNFNPVVVEMDNSFRVYKALPVKKPCLACHGDNNSMNSNVKELINKTYPKDLATDFKEGEFRGVVISEIQK